MNIADSIGPPGLMEKVVQADLRERYLNDVYAYVIRRVERIEDAEDVTAETFRSALGSFHRLRGADPKLWLLGIARRKVADALRRRYRKREQPISDKLAAPESLTDLATKNEAAAAIRRIVLALPEAQREALLLQHLEGLTIAEIAVVMGRSRAAINSLLERARAHAFKEGRAYFVEDPS